ncbi:MAG: hypothetical protein MI976_17860 [Pseudomonadales bacterium]|nr:hypothetical protein [Pseudomonadales bacterium]
MNTNTKSYSLSQNAVMGVSVLFLWVVLSMVSGCDQQPSPGEAPAPESAATSTPDKSSTPAKISTTADAHTTEVTPTSKKVEQAVDTAGLNDPEEGEKKQVKKKLDLNLSETDMALGRHSETERQQKVLPNMFDAKKSGTKVGGGIIRDEENENYMDSIQGAKLNVEFQTD